MKIGDIIQFLKDNITPLAHNYNGGHLYCCSAELMDGTKIPCITFQEFKYKNMSTLRRQNHNSFKIFANSGFYCAENSLDSYYIKQLSISDFAIPEEIRAEASCELTEFTAIMKDQNTFNFKTRSNDLFFDMPAGYSGSDIVQIKPTQINADKENAKSFQEKFYFKCYIENGMHRLTNNA